MQLKVIRGVWLTQTASSGGLNQTALEDSDALFLETFTSKLAYILASGGPSDKLSAIANSIQWRWQCFLPLNKYLLLSANILHAATTAKELK